jgi:hypothetical protein
MKPSWGETLRTVPTDGATVGPHLYLPESVVGETERLLKTYGGDDDHEGVVYLGGVEVAGGAVALVALSPIAETTRGSFQTDLDANTAVVRALGKYELSLVGQVHSHPGEWVDHSEGDDAGALVRFEGYWSFVVPAFAHRGMRPLTRCGVHIFRKGRFRRLNNPAIGARVHLVPSSADLRQG